MLANSIIGEEARGTPARHSDPTLGLPLLLRGVALLVVLAVGILGPIRAEGQPIEEMTIDEARVAAEAAPVGAMRTDGTVCDRYFGAAYALCDAYCEALDCDATGLGRTPCQRLRENFEWQTGTPVFPCDVACGNGVVDDGEDCDPPNDFCRGGCNPMFPICVDIACSDQCRCPQSACGDLVVDPGEECDDGNNVDGDFCSSLCRIEGTSCGGARSLPCPSGEFCQYVPSTCGYPDLYGICTQITPHCISLCPEIFDPVCGCDRSTYNNDCMMLCGETSLAHRGACEADL